MRALRFLLPLLLAACSTVPGTGRTRLAPLMGMSEQLQLGAEAYDEMLADAKVITSGAQAAMVQRVGQRIAACDQLKKWFPEAAEDFQWEFKLVDDPGMVNAWALPGGKCAVYTGLLPVTKDEDGLAAVLGHEIAHAVAEHGAERMTQGTYVNLGLAGVDATLSNDDPETKGMILGALGVGANLGVMLPFSRTHESESDELGAYFAASAGYDPRAAVELWQRMSQLGGQKPPEFLSTHPSDETRIEDLKAIMPKAMNIYEASQM